MKTLNKHTFERVSKYGNEKNVEIYKDTLLKATQYPRWDQQTVKNKTNTPLHTARANRFEGKITVMPTDCVSALIHLTDTDPRKFVTFAMLNMASAKRPGGGVAKGAKAQEECLFRSSNLGLLISPQHYPLLEDEYLYTHSAVFFKDFNYNDTADGYICDIITCAAINLNENAKYGYSKKDIDSVDPLKDATYLQIMNDKIAAIIDSAIISGVNKLILGAWGCGVFKNDPNFVAQCFLDNLNKDNKRYYFDEIIFAVINDHNSVANNYEIFNNILSNAKSYEKESRV